MRTPRRELLTKARHELRTFVMSLVSSPLETTPGCLRAGKPDSRLHILRIPNLDWYGALELANCYMSPVKTSPMGMIR